MGQIRWKKKTQLITHFEAGRFARALYGFGWKKLRDNSIKCPSNYQPEKNISLRRPSSLHTREPFLQPETIKMN